MADETKKKSAAKKEPKPEAAAGDKPAGEAHPAKGKKAAAAEETGAKPGEAAPAAGAPEGGASRRRGVGVPGEVFRGASAERPRQRRVLSSRPRRPEAA